MPQANQALTDRILLKFGTKDDGPIGKFLEDAGWSLLPDYRWSPPITISHHLDVPGDQTDAICFLMEEWDYGGVIAEESFWMRRDG